MNPDQKINHILDQIQGLDKKIKPFFRGPAYTKFLIAVENRLISEQRLLECDQNSLIGTILAIASLKLYPDFGQAFIKPRRILSKDKKGFESFKWITQLEIGYLGWLEILYRQHSILSVKPGIFYANEPFEEIQGSQTMIKHIPLRPNERGERSGAYAVAHLAGAPYPEVTVVHKEELDKIKQMSLQYSPGYSLWENEDRDPFGWMWKKTAIKQLAKSLPKTDYLISAMEYDNLQESGSIITLDKNKNIKLSETELSLLAKKKAMSRHKSKNVVNSTLSLFEKETKKI